MQMILRLVSVAIIVYAAYWYWSGPYQARVNPTYEQKLQTYQKQMSDCIRGMNYRQEAGGVNDGIPEEVCAKRYNVYRADDGRWHSYDDARP